MAPGLARRFKEDVMTGKRIVAGLMCAAVLGCGAAFAAEVDLKAAARSIVARHGAAVVPLKVVTKVTGSRGSREHEAKLLGTVLDATGLIVTSNSVADPASAQKKARPELTIESEVKSAKLIETKTDGTEIPLKVVFRDRDLDLMFLRPEKKTKLAHLGLKKKGPELGLADDVIALSRLGAVGDRQLAVSLGRVLSVIDKPRRLYIVNGVQAALGCPAFSPEGEVVGIFVLRITPTPGRPQMLTPVLPIADVLGDMRQIKASED